MTIGDRVQSIYKGIPYVGKIVNVNNHDRIRSCIVTVELEKPLHVDGTVLEKVYTQSQDVELVC